MAWNYQLALETSAQGVALGALFMSPYLLTTTNPTGANQMKTITPTPTPTTFFLPAEVVAGLFGADALERRAQVIGGQEKRGRG